MSAPLLPKKGLKKKVLEVSRVIRGPSVTDVAYRPATTEELDRSLTNRKQELQELHEGYKEKKKELREAVLKYRRLNTKEGDTEAKAAAKADVLRLTKDISEDYFSQESVMNSIHVLKYNPLSNKNAIESIPTYGYLYRDLTFEHNRTTKIPEDVGILTYPEAYPANWFFKPKVEVAASAAPAALGAAVGSENQKPQQGGSDEPKKQLSSRQIGAIIAARKAGRF